MKAEILNGLNLTEFVAVDLETTGLDPTFEEIIEFGAVKYRAGEAVDTLSFLLKPRKTISEFITRLTGISNDDVESAKTFKDKLDDIRNFVSDLPVVAHNIQFDLQFLEHHARRVHDNYESWNRNNKEFIYFPNPRLDTVILSRIFLPFLPSHSLDALTRYYGIERANTHRALPDARACGELFMKLIDISLRTSFQDVQKILDILDTTEEPVKSYFQKLAVFLSSASVPETTGIDRDQFDSQANYFNVIGQISKQGKIADEVEPINRSEVSDFFVEGGRLSQEFKRFEARAPQVEMASEIATAFNESKMLAVEAGTGTGKSLAYLLPAIKWAIQNYGEAGRVIISTNTKNLQEQLFFKDLPLLNAVLEDDFKAVLLKGSGNYLCLDKWTRVMRDLEHSLSDSERARLLPLYLWVEQTETGDISENAGFRAERNFGLWSKLIAENNYCPGRICKHYDKCYLMKARNNAQNAHVVVVNHSLLFSDLAVDNAILKEYANLVFDEAHNIEKTATEYLGAEASYWQFRDLLNKLYLKERRRRKGKSSQAGRELGILIKLQKRIGEGTLPQRNYDWIKKSAAELIKLIPKCRLNLDNFFRELTAELQSQSGSKEKRFSNRHRYVQDDNIFENVLTSYDDLLRTLGVLRSKIGNLIEYMRELPEEQFEEQRQIYQDLQAQFSTCEMLYGNLQMLISAKSAEYVFWFELPNKSESIDTRLYAAPLEVGPLLNDLLYSRLRTGIFTSATLAVNNNFNYFFRTTGLDQLPPERTNSIVLDSPFNYPEQSLLLVPSFIEGPSHPDFVPELGRLVNALGQEYRKGTLVLFTSYAMLNRVYDDVREDFQESELLLLGQGIDGSRHAIINRFREQTSSFLLGTDSFWEGVDVPGKALEMVLLTRLPFDVPSEPVLEARSEYIQARGGNPFMELSIPEAVIRFRQGFGRLIRTAEDYGAVLVLDNRVIKKFYGRVFLESLPVEAKIVSSNEELFSNLNSWFGV